MALTADQLGQRLREARQRQGLTLQALAERTGHSLRFLSELERGKPGAAIGAVLAVAEQLGLALTLAEAGTPRVDLDRYPQLRLLAWQRRGERYVDEPEALALYEGNWRFVEPERLLPRERALIERLARRYGHGVLNV